MTGQVVRVRRSPSARTPSRTPTRGSRPSRTASPPDTRQIIATVLEHLGLPAPDDCGGGGDPHLLEGEGSLSPGWDQESSTITDLDVDGLLDELLERVDLEGSTSSCADSHPHLTHDLVLIPSDFDPCRARVAQEPLVPPPLVKKIVRSRQGMSEPPVNRKRSQRRSPRPVDAGSPGFALLVAQPRTPDPDPIGQPPPLPPKATRPSVGSRPRNPLLAPGALLEGRSVREVGASDPFLEAAPPETEDPAAPDPDAPPRSSSRTSVALFLATLFLATSATVCTSVLLESGGLLRTSLSDLFHSIPLD